jgi:hypothetical protein
VIPRLGAPRDLGLLPMVPDREVHAHVQQRCGRHDEPRLALLQQPQGPRRRPAAFGGDVRLQVENHALGAAFGAVNAKEERASCEASLPQPTLPFCHLAAARLCRPCSAGTGLPRGAAMPQLMRAYE